MVPTTHALRQQSLHDLRVESSRIESNRMFPREAGSFFKWLAASVRYVEASHTFQQITSASDGHCLNSKIAQKNGISYITSASGNHLQVAITSFFFVAPESSKPPDTEGTSCHLCLTANVQGEEGAPMLHFEAGSSRRTSHQ